MHAYSFLWQEGAGEEDICSLVTIKTMKMGKMNDFKLKNLLTGRCYHVLMREQMCIYYCIANDLWHKALLNLICVNS